jgi:hypothetical protein
MAQAFGAALWAASRGAALQAAVRGAAPAAAAAAKRGLSAAGSEVRSTAEVMLSVCCGSRRAPLQLNPTLALWSPQAAGEVGGPETPGQGLAAFARKHAAFTLLATAATLAAGAGGVGAALLHIDGKVDQVSTKVSTKVDKLRDDVRGDIKELRGEIQAVGAKLVAHLLEAAL